MKLVSSLNHDNDKYEAPYSQQNEEDGNEEELDLNTPHCGLPILTEDSLVLLHLVITNSYETHSDPISVPIVV